MQIDWWILLAALAIYPLAVLLVAMTGPHSHAEQENSDER